MKSGTFLLIIGAAAFVITYLVLNWIGIEENSGSIGIAVALLAVAIVAYKIFVNPDSNTTAKRHGPFYWDDKNRMVCETCSKLAYDSEDEADDAAGYMLREHGFGNRSYYSKRCNFWHLASVR